MTADPRPFEYRQIWQQKPVLRRLYERYYRDIARRCRPGRTLEIGGGSGNLKGFLGDIVSTDRLFGPWLDAVADAGALPFAAASFDNIVLFDVLHHLSAPGRFLAEAERVLCLGGRLILIEPAITPVSGLFYRVFHPEPVVMTADPLAEAAPGRDPWQANQAIPTLLFGRHRRSFEAACPGLLLVELRRFALVSYPLSGGFRRWSLLPASLVDPLCTIEHWLEPVLGRLMAFRLLAVLERTGWGGPEGAAQNQAEDDRQDEGTDGPLEQEE
jgi:SAM-dependent methyltransferase